MTIRTRAFLPTDGVSFSSDVESIDFRSGDLTVTLACSIDDARNVRGLEVTFRGVTGFRLLDEVDLARYWHNGEIAFGTHVLEVESGGWSAEENELQGYEASRREWLVVSGNACVSVFCLSAPEARNTSWPKAT